MFAFVRLREFRDFFFQRRVHADGMTERELESNAEDCRCRVGVGREVVRGRGDKMFVILSTCKLTGSSRKSVSGTEHDGININHYPRACLSVSPPTSKKETDVRGECDRWIGSFLGRRRGASGIHSQCAWFIYAAKCTGMHETGGICYTVIADLKYQIASCCTDRVVQYG